jgi:predicted nucleic acid-binding protein
VSNRLIALGIRGRHWTDAYLAAFATAGGYRLVSFDAGFARYPGLAWLHLRSEPPASAPPQP